jgi:hypothetical protein
MSPSPKTTFILPLPLPPSLVKPGTFTLNPSNPPTDAFDPHPATSPSVFTTEIASLESTFSDTTATTFKALLTQYASSWLSTSSGTALNLSAVSVKEYNLGNQRQYFDDACALPTTRQWLEKALEYGEGGAVRLITGFRTFVDMSISQQSNQNWGVSGKMTVPMEAMATGIPLPLVGLNVGVESSVERKGGVQRSYEAKGEMVFAIQVRKVTFKWFSSRAEGAKLDRKTAWKVLWAVRGDAGADEQDDIVEAVIGDGEDDGGEQQEDDEDEDEVAQDHVFELEAGAGQRETVVFAQEAAVRK